MGTGSVVAIADEITEEQYIQESVRQEILLQLDLITRSTPFRNSKRYPALLRYIVEEVLAGHAESLKERTLGMCVFERSADYDTNMDPVVRVSAGEVRKRIAQYYQVPGHEVQLRIEIPLGSYVPRFYRPAEHGWIAEKPNPAGVVPPDAVDLTQEEALPPIPAPANVAVTADDLPGLADNHARGNNSPGSRVHLLAMYVLLAGALGAIGWMLVSASRPPRLIPAVRLFWGSLLRSPTPTLIVLGVHSFDAKGNDISSSSHASMPQPQQTLLSAMTRSDMVHLSDVTSYGALTQLLTNHRHTFHTQGAADTTLEQLRQGPFVLIGGFNNLWTTRLTTQLRFRFVTTANWRNVIQDSEHPERTWTLDDSRSALSNSRDYGLVSCFLDPETEQYGIIVGGIGKSGTEAAADFVTSEAGLDEWLRSAHLPPATNVQVLVETDVIEGKHGPPHVVASYAW